MAKDSPYFQFPVKMLASESDTGSLVQNICSYSLWHYGVSLWETTPEQVESLAEEYMAGRPHLNGLDRKNSEHQIVMAAAERLNVGLSNIALTLSAAQKMHAKYGVTGTQCRIRADIAWSAHDDQWPILKFKVLCGVIAGIGNNQAVKLNHRMIQALASGYNSPKGLLESDMLAKSSVRYWIEQLWFSNFFQHCKRGQECWYSISTASDQAFAKVVHQMPAKKRVKTKIDVST